MKNDALGQLAVQRGYISTEQLQFALALQTQSDPRPKLGSVLIEQGYLDLEHLDRLMNLQTQLRQSDAELFGEIALKLKFVTHDQLEGCLEEWRTLVFEGKQVQLGQIMVKRRALTVEQLLTILRHQSKVLMRCPKCDRKFTVPLQQKVPVCNHCRITLQMLLEVTDPGASAPLPPSEPPRRRIGKYELLLVAGQGGKGMVFKARDTELDRIVAVKVLKQTEGLQPDQVKRFVREARLAGKLRHPNIVRVYDIGAEGDVHYFVMDYVSGRGLDAAIRDKSLSIKQAVPMMIKVARAVHHAHTHGIVHRDLKPANILLDESGEPFVTDFGLAKEISSQSELTKSGTTMGTPYYMSPEQAGGQNRDVDARSDVFALGVILYECVTRRLPFAGATMMEICNRICKDTPMPPSTHSRAVPRDLETIILTALRKDKSKRYATALEFAEDLARFAAGESVHAQPPTPMDRIRKFIRLRSTILATVGVTLALTLFVVALFWNRSSTPQRVDLAAVNKAETKASQQRELDAGLYATWEEVRSALFASYRSRRAEPKELAAFRDHLKQFLRRFDQIVLANSDLNTSLAYYFRARLLMETMQYDKAIREIEQAIRVEEDAHGANAGLYRLLFANACVEEQIYLLGESGHQRELLRKAQEAIAQVPRGSIGKEQQDIVALISAVDEAIKGKYDEATDQLEALYQKKHEPTFRYAIGAVCLTASWVDRKNAARYLERVVKSQDSLLEELPLFAKARLARAHALLALSRLHEAAADAGIVIETFPDIPDAYVVRAGAQAFLGNYRDTIQDCTAALERDPDNGYAYMQRAMAKVSLGELDGAREDAEIAIQKDPKSAAGYLARGSVLLLEQRGAEGAREIERGLELEPDLPEAQSLRVAAALVRRDFPGATSACNEWIAQEPASAIAYAMRAWVFLLQQKLDEALADAQKALELSDEIPQARCVRGLAFYGKKEFKRARQDLEFCKDHPQFKDIVAQILPKLPQ